MMTLEQARAAAARNEPLPAEFYLDHQGEVQVKLGRAVWTGKYEDWRIDWATYGGPYIRYPAWPHPENQRDIARLSFADPTPFEVKRIRAALIAAAPDMREALQKFVDAYPHGINLDLDTAYSEARAALRKANGKI